MLSGGVLPLNGNILTCTTSTPTPHCPERLEICDFRVEGFEEALPDWLANLSSLRYLGIDNCKNLKYLPSSIAIQRLSKLKGLRILGGFPHLSENCRKENGSEWPKISHIPTIDIV